MGWELKCLNIALGLGVQGGLWLTSGFRGQGLGFRLGSRRRVSAKKMTENAMETPRFEY